MQELNPLIESLNSFRNLYYAVLRCIEKDPKSVCVLSPILGLTHNSVRHRIRKPQLWQVNDIEKIARYYELPTSAFTRMRETIPVIAFSLNHISIERRKRLKKGNHVKLFLLAKRLTSNGLVIDVDTLHQGLTQLID